MRLFDYEVYNFKDSGDGKSWLIGDDSSASANAFIGGYSKCPVDIVVPRSLTSKEGETKPIEVIGQSAYDYCGNPDFGYKTKTVLITKQVRIIKERGFGHMNNVESFRIEEGCGLQSIEKDGLHCIGYNTGRDNPKKRGTLTLPSTLSSVSQNGISECNLFKIIIYCGIYSLPNKCDLEYNVNDETKVRVTNQYSASTIFGRTPLKDSQTEVEGNCSRIDGKPKSTPLPSHSVSPSTSSSPSSSIPTPSCNCPQRSPPFSLFLFFFFFHITFNFILLSFFRRSPQIRPFLLSLCFSICLLLIFLPLLISLS